MSLQLVGVLEEDPHVDAGECRVTLAANGKVYEVLVSSAHARWVTSIEAGELVEVVGQLAGPGLVHGLYVWPLETPVD